ncbi:hypothetical protein EBU94_05590, partial [bacterium]|nr:hypothetical protein [bacterium]
DDLIDKLKEIAKRFQVETKNITKEKITNEGYGESPDLEIKLYHDVTLKLSEKFQLENDFSKLAGFDFVLFKEGYMLLRFS